VVVGDAVADSEISAASIFRVYWSVPVYVHNSVFKRNRRHEVIWKLMIYYENVTDANFS
jgi:hypothetical protein